MRLLLLGFLSCLLLISCHTRNIIAPDLTPSTPLTFTGDTIPIPNSNEFIFRQIIQLRTHSEDEVYAWKILTTNDLLPADIQVDADGWMINAATGSIWSERSTLQFDFPSADGKLHQIIAKVLMKVKKNGIEQPFVEVPFRSDRLLGTVIQAPFTNGATTGAGFQISLLENITNIFVEGMYAHHFMYRLNRTNANGDVLAYGLWYNSIDGEDIRKINFSMTTTPALIQNAEGELTQFETYVVSRQGIEEETHQTINFKVAGNYSPQTIIYRQTTMALGAYHYTTNLNSTINYYNLIPGHDAGHYNRPFFRDDNTYSVVNSSDLQVCLSWGYHGQFGVRTVGVIPMDTVTDDPNDIVTNICMDSLDTNYYASIQYYDLRLNNAPFPIQPSFGETQVVTNPNGTSWLRVRSKPGLQTVILTGLPSGSYRFEVRAVDSQGSLDPTPSVFSFTINDYVPVASRSGILIVDDDANNNTFAPDAIIDQIYNAIVPTQYGSVDQFDYAQNELSPDPLGSRLPVSNMFSKKLLIWHSDGGYSSSHISWELDALNIYLDNGGKLIISGGQNLCPEFQSIATKYPEFIPDHFGNNDILTNIHAVQTTNSYLQRPWFVSAISEAPGYEDIPLNLTTPFNTLLNTRQGLGPVSYFDNPGMGTGLYLYGSKTPGQDSYSPDQANYDVLVTKHVAVRYDHDMSMIAVFGFPLSYMEQTPTQQMLNTLISSMLQSKRNK